MYEKFSSYMDSQQRAAVEAPIDTPVLVLAGAGSGKTRVLLLRIIYLLDKGIKPESMIVTTFSKKAADELKSRISKVTDDQSLAKSINCGTIHSLCYRILREEGLNATIMTDYSRQKILEQSISSIHGIDFGWKYPEYWISRCKSELVKPISSKEFLYKRLIVSGVESNEADIIATQLAMIYIDYEKDKNSNNYIDYDDMLYLLGLKLKDSKNDLKSRLQNRFDYVLIDEAQDDSRLAVEILETMAAPENHIFVCGDDLQSIYGWNGADPNHNIFSFLSRFPNAKLYKIETNYRSTQVIVNSSNKLVDSQYGEEKVQFKKFLKPAQSAIVGKEVLLCQSIDELDEAKNIVNWINELITHESQKPGDFFVLYRTNAQSRASEEELIKSAIPYTVTSGLGFYDRAIIKDIMAFIQLSEDRTDNDSFRRIANIASVDYASNIRYVGNAFFGDCQAADPVLWNGMLKIKNTQPRLKRLAIEDFVQLMQKIENVGQHDPTKTIFAIRQLAYDNWIQHKMGIPEGHDVNDVFEDLTEFQSSATRFKTNEELLKYVEIIKKKNKEKRTDDANVVTLSTVHKVKGLEKNNVAIIGMNEDILPHWRVTKPELANDKLPIDIKQEITDERCICFVAVTRAKERLMIDVLESYRGKPVEASRFLREMNILKKED